MDRRQSEKTDFGKQDGAGYSSSSLGPKITFLHLGWDKKPGYKQKNLTACIRTQINRITAEEKSAQKSLWGICLQKTTLRGNM